LQAWLIMSTHLLHCHARLLLLLLQTSTTE